MLVGKTVVNRPPNFRLPPDWGQGSRGCWSGGGPGAGEGSDEFADNTYYVNISTIGTAMFFGDITYNMWRCAGASGGGRGLICGGTNHNTPKENISYHTIATRANSTHFGNLTTQRAVCTATSNGVRAIIMGGSTSSNAVPDLTTIDYITIASPGNATNFGNLTTGTNWRTDGAGDGTYGMTPVNSNGSYSGAKYDYVAIDTPGNTSLFGSKNEISDRSAGNSNGSRAFWSGGYTGAWHTHIDYLTWSTTSNALQYGALASNMYRGRGCEDGSRACSGGGNAFSDANIRYFSMDLAAGSSVIGATFGTIAGNSGAGGKRQDPAAYAGD